MPRGVLLVGSPDTGKTMLARAVAGEAGVPFFSSARGAPGMGGHDEKGQTLNQLLAEMDGFDPSAGLVLLAATNRLDVLDAALLRAGRFDRQVLVDWPDRLGRIAILKGHTRKTKLAAGVALEQVAKLTPGVSGADLANLCSEAALAATCRRANGVTRDDFTVAVERIVAGLENKMQVLLGGRAAEHIVFGEVSTCARCWRQARSNCWTRKR